MQKHFLRLFVFLSIIFLTTSCFNAPIPSPPVSAETPTLTPNPPSENKNQDDPIFADYPLAVSGPYEVGTLYNIELVDEPRSNREIGLTIWYPAAGREEDEQSKKSVYPPDRSGAPYPLIISSTKVGNLFARHLVSHGFVWVGIDKINSLERWDLDVLNQPIDIVFAYNYLVNREVPGIEGIADFENVGSTGYSFDSLNSLLVSGGRINEAAYFQNCANAETFEPELEDWWVEYNCDLRENWAAFAKLAGPEVRVKDGLWQPISNVPVKAVIPMAVEGAWLFDRDGLGTITIPALIIGAEKDTLNFYALETIPIYEHLGSPEKFLITFLEKDHMMIYTSQDVYRMKHFMLAFFGYYLKGLQDHQYYFSQEFVDQREELHWGIP